MFAVYRGYGGRNSGDSWDEWVKSYDWRGINFTSYGGKLLPTPMLYLLGLVAGSVDLGDESSWLYLPIILRLSITEAIN